MDALEEGADSATVEQEVSETLESFTASLMLAEGSDEEVDEQERISLA